MAVVSLPSRVSPLIGRDTDLATLAEALEEAKRGAGRVVLVAGDAGMGKTRMAREFVAQAEADASTVLWGTCSELELALPFLPFNEAIGTYLATTDVAALREQLGPLTEAVTAVVPQLSNQTAEPSDLCEDGVRLRLFEGVVAVLRAVTREARAGAVLVVDDVQWADASTRALLDFVARRIRHLPLLLVMMYRCDEVSSAHPLRGVLDGWRRAGLASTLTLRPLAGREVGRLVCDRLGVERVSRGLVEVLVKRTEGVPFAVEEVLEAAISAGHIFQRDGVWLRSALSQVDLPESLAVGILQRLERLAPEHRRVVTAAAVLGYRFDPRVLPALTGLPAGVVSAALRCATNAHFVESDPSDRSLLRFHHALTHESVCGSVHLWEASDLHSRAADVIAHTAPPAPVIDRARHLLAAGRVSDAAPLCADAAQMASRAGAFAEAAVLFEHALAGVADPAQRAWLLHERGRMLVAGGAPATAIAPLREAVALADEAAYAATPRYLVTLGGAHWIVGDHRASLEAYERARTLLEAGPPTPELALVYARLAMWRIFDFDCEAGLELAEAALTLADKLDDEQARVPALMYRGAALCELGHRDEGLAVIDRATAEAARLTLPQDIGSGVTISAAQRALGMCARELPAMGEFLRRVDMGPASDVFASFVEALAGRCFGDVGKTEVAALAMVDGAESLGSGLLAFLGREFLAWARLKQGRLAEAEALMDDLDEQQGMWHRSWGPSRVELAMAMHDPDRAAEQARALLARVPAAVRDPFVASIVVPAFLAAGAGPDAEVCVSAALGPDRHPMAVGAAADLAAYRGQTDYAAELYTEAIDGASAAGYHLIASEYRGRRTRPPEVPLPVPVPQDVCDRATGLSPREQELLALLANGKTDQQIAHSLCVSIFTVRSHLDRIREKTGRRRRPALTLLAIELGLLNGSAS